MKKSHQWASAAGWIMTRMLGFWLVFGLPQMVEGAFIIIVGDYELKPEMTEQHVDLYFINTGTPQEVAGLDINLQVGDGGPAYGGSRLGPTITQIELINRTVFEGSGATQVTAPSADQVRVESITLGSGTVAVPVVEDASLLLAKVTFDTTGFDAIGESWSLMINNTLNGDTQFLDGSANLLAVVSTAGSITIAPVPEPAAIGVVAGMLLIGFRIWVKRRDCVPD